ncbi:MAG TPA: hypothetical protein VFS05_00525 [Gemmatimonadaceae bacterium]|nr:hypothetical protein [Gemmatimonadaceae bacterium]
MTPRLLIATLAILAAPAAGAQSLVSAGVDTSAPPPAPAPAASVARSPRALAPVGPAPSAVDSAVAARRSATRRFRTHFALGFITSILAHEAGHVIASYAVGGHPSFGFDKGRPTIYSGVDATLDPHKQFIFSSAGLTMQALLDEAILDVPHRRGAAFERGILAGGIATVIFYTTIGRNGSVSDVAFMARTSSLSKTDVSLIYGAIAALHAVRIHRDSHYAHFFAAPAPEGGLRIGMMVGSGT